MNRYLNKIKTLFKQLDPNIYMVKIQLFFQNLIMFRFNTFEVK
jgi:hypothetical protein